MPDLEIPELPPAHERLVRDFLSTQLDPHMGRAEASFRQFVATQPAPVTGKMFPFPIHLPNRLNNWTVGIVSAALAASVAAFWSGPSFREVTPVTGVGVPSHQVMPVNQRVEQDVQSQTFDDGTYVMDGDQPVRVLRRRDLQRTRWFDQNEKLSGEKVVPQDHIIYVPLKTY